MSMTAGQPPKPQYVFSLIAQEGIFFLVQFVNQCSVESQIKTLSPRKEQKRAGRAEPFRTKRKAKTLLLLKRTETRRKSKPLFENHFKERIRGTPRSSAVKRS
jgi:hypothetical protein